MHEAPFSANFWWPFSLQLNPEIDIRSHDPDRAAEIDTAGTGQPYIVRAPVLDATERATHARCAVGKNRAGEVCQPDCSWPIGTYQ